MADHLTNPKYIELGEFRAKLADRTGKQYWRSLDELADTDEFREVVYREFPKAASEWDDHHSRRNFLKLMGASLALAGLGTAGCNDRRQEKIVPYVQQPEHMVPGKPLFFASAMPWRGFGMGVLVEQHEGRPTKVEGNPEHPASQGATNPFMQASVLDLYDPNRSQTVLRNGHNNTWNTFIRETLDQIRYEPGPGGVKAFRKTPLRVRILTETVTSPTLAAQIEAFRKAVPETRWHVFDPVGRDNALEGARRAFGRVLAPVYHFERAKVILSLDSNFLYDDPGSVRYSRDFIKSRGVNGTHRPTKAAEMSRLYVVESTPTITGAKADSALRLSPAGVRAVAQRIARAVGGEAGGGSSAGEFAAGEAAATQPATTGPAAGEVISGADSRQAKAINAFIDAVAGDLERARAEGKGAVVVAGEWQPPEVHALAYAMNAALGSIGEGKPLSFITPPEANPVNGIESLRELTEALARDEVDVLLILGGNPVYKAPADLDFAGKLKAFTERGGGGKPGWSVHLGLHVDETARLCFWHLPEAHYLEAWGDVRAYDGTASVVQPLIHPLYEGRTAVEVIASLLERQSSGEESAERPIGSADSPAGTGGPETRPGAPALTRLSAYDIVRDYWRGKLGGQDFEAAWERALMAGVIEGTAFAPDRESGSARIDLAAAAAAVPADPRPAGPNTLTLVFRPDPNVWDGTFANNGWLQELPKPLTKLTWDNAVLISPTTARQLGLLGKNEAANKTGDSDKLNQINGRLVTLTVGEGAQQRTLPVTDGAGAPGKHFPGPLPLWVLPGHPNGCATLHLGYGRNSAGNVGNGLGFNAYALRTTDRFWFAEGARLTLLDGRYPLASTQGHQLIDTKTNDAREIVMHGQDAEEIRHHMLLKVPPEQRAEYGSRYGLTVIPDAPERSRASAYPNAPDQGHKPRDPNNPQPTDNPAHPGHNPAYPAWGMVIDMTACIGCNACVVACQSENNIPVVGKDQVLGSRFMHWLRIDTYYVTHPDNPDSLDHPDVIFQPLPCMHCEKAPCEVVCPVAATSHSTEGINEMTYNRCVGTRYCSNNCPYKVRRFNFLQYSDTASPSLRLMRNPDVTVRNRGVMEKCTYCIQRIAHARIHSKRKLADAADPNFAGSKQEKLDEAQKAINSVVTACAQACPTEAIVFGNMADQTTDVVQLKKLPQNYGLLDLELQTQPRTTYLARLNNPHPEFEKVVRPEPKGGHGGGHGGGHDRETSQPPTGAPDASTGKQPGH